jgi:hypothetical protein
MIITWLNGGLGNQMFQYAAGLALAHQRRTVLKLDVSWFREYAGLEAHNIYGLHCFNIQGQFATQDEVARLCGRPLSFAERSLLPLARALRLHDWTGRHTPAGRQHQARAFHFYPEFFDLPDNTMISGWWQSEKFFAPVAGLLRLQFSFRYPPLPEVASLAERIRSGPSAAVHFRRGDYTRNSTFNQTIGVVDSAYYENAVRRLRERSPQATLYVFSDDIEAVAREFHPPGPHVFVRCVEHWHPWDKIRLMSLCDHFVIANSTFSWWAAWLNPSPEKLVIAPDPWFVNSVHDSSDVVPGNWTRLPIAS